MSRSVHSSRASLTVRITVKSGDPPGAGKIWENQFFTGKADFHGANCSQIGTYTCQGTRKSGQNFFHLHIHGRRSHFSGGHLWFLKECTKLVKLDFSSSRFIFVTTSISHIPPPLLLHSKALSVNACRIMVQKNVVLIKIWSDLLYFLSSSSSVGVLSAYTKLDIDCSEVSHPSSSTETLPGASFIISYDFIPRRTLFASSGLAQAWC